MESKTIFLHQDDSLFSTHSTKLEVIWTIIPTVILLLITVPSFILLYTLDQIAQPEVILKVIGHQ